MALRLLTTRVVAGHARQLVALGLVFALSFSGFLFLAMVTKGATTAIVEPIEAMITGDLRLSEGDANITAGKVWENATSVARGLVLPDGGALAPRFESNYVAIRGLAVHNWSAGLFIGFDTSVPEERASLQRYLLVGAVPSEENATDPGTRRGYAPLLIGRPAAERLGLPVDERWSPDFGRTLLMSSGRTVEGQGLGLPSTIRGVVVGIFETGIEPLDKFSAYVPIEWVRQLEGHARHAPVANAFVYHGPHADAMRNEAREEGLRARTGEAYARDYLGSFFTVVLALIAVQLVLYTVLLLVWVGYALERGIKRDAAAVATLRALGVPFASVRGAYLTAFGLAVGLAALVAGAAALAVDAWAPRIALHVAGAPARLPLILDDRVLLPLAAGAALALVVVGWKVTRALRKVNIREALQAG